MAKGAYYVGVTGIDELREALLATSRGLIADESLPMQPYYLNIAEEGAREARSKAPVGRPSRKDSRSHLPPGSLRDSIVAGATSKSAWIRSDWEGPLILQEFGGKSWWKRGREGGWATGAAYGRSRSVGAFTTRSARFRQHLVYEKPRVKFGYFIWNVGYRIRHYTGRQIAEGLRDIAARNGLAIDIASDGALQGDLRAEEFRRTV